MPVSQSVEQIVDDPTPQVVMDTVVEQIVDVPVLECQEGNAEQIVDFTVPTIKDELVEVIQPRPQDCTQGRLAEQIVDFAVPPIKEELAEATALGGRPRADRGADSGTPRATDQGEHRDGVSGSASGAHRARRGTELPKACRRRIR